MKTHASVSMLLRFALLFAVMLPFAGCASSQDSSQDGTTQEDDRSAQRITQRLAAIDTAVDLTDAQAARVREILEEAEASRPARPPRGQQAGRGERPPGMPARGMRGGVDPRAETDRLIEATLTEEQVERYRTWRASQPAPGSRRRGGASPQ